MDLINELDLKPWDRPDEDGFQSFQYLYNMRAYCIQLTHNTIHIQDMRTGVNLHLSSWIEGLSNYVINNILNEKRLWTS